ncbi:uncharacterized protein DS421_16g553920 [Arachis hypogaea]|nr:uncharacterized protein DS421_16g553920 [Arachis hypogaea]
MEEQELPTPSSSIFLLLSPNLRSNKNSSEVITDKLELEIGSTHTITEVSILTDLLSPLTDN